jgi:hypothetical protein
VSALRPIVEEGRLVERECPDCGNVERRAFGEFESTRGELASYAFGWTSGHDEVVGYMTIGIGAGNPGGGSFHAELRPTDDWYGLTLVDRRFEAVPEGGPDLTREQALAHEDLKFIWFVADEVMAQDRRAQWMTHWVLATVAYVTEPVLHETSPVRHVVRDREDGDWQLLCGTTAGDEPHLFHLFHALDHDRTLLDVLDLEPGERADRNDPDSPWIRSTYEEEDDE